jgi:hypothetical protein
MFSSDSCSRTLKEVGSKHKAPYHRRNASLKLIKDCAATIPEIPLEEKIQRLCIMSARVPENTLVTHPTSRESAAFDVLNMRKLFHITEVLIEEASNATEEEERATMTDSFLPIYSTIVALAEIKLGLTNSATKQIPLNPSFALDMGVIGPLYEVSRHCRDPTLRRKIVHLLRISNRQEGLLNSATYAKIVQTIIDIEESGLEDVKVSGDIPLTSRISRHCLSFDMKRLRHTLSFRWVVEDDEERGLSSREILI